MSKKQPNKEDLQVSYEYVDPKDDDDQLYDILELLLPSSELAEIIKKTRDGSEQRSIIR